MMSPGSTVPSVICRRCHIELFERGNQIGNVDLAVAGRCAGVAEDGDFVRQKGIVLDEDGAGEIFARGKDSDVQTGLYKRGDILPRAGRSLFHNSGGPPDKRCSAGRWQWSGQETDDRVFEFLC